MSKRKGEPYRLQKALRRDPMLQDYFVAICLQVAAAQHTLDPEWSQTKFGAAFGLTKEDTSRVFCGQPVSPKTVSQRTKMDMVRRALGQWTQPLFKWCFGDPDYAGEQADLPIDELYQSRPGCTYARYECIDAELVKDLDQQVKVVRHHQAEIWAVKDEIIKRLERVEDQLEGLQQRVEGDEYHHDQLVTELRRVLPTAGIFEVHCERP